MKLFFILFWALALTGCSTVKSSLNYTKGTAALKERDYDTAIVHLEKAVQLDPTDSKSHNNLACAYFETGRIKEGWPHVRHAVILRPKNAYAQENFRRYFSKLIHDGDVKKGYSEALIVQNLGEPDNVLKRRDGTLWQYGMVALYFKDGQVTGFNNMELR